MVSSYILLMCVWKRFSAYKITKSISFHIRACALSRVAAFQQEAHLHFYAKGTGPALSRCPCRPVLDSPWHNWARFGGTRGKPYLCLGKKRKGTGLSSFRVFRGKLSYMSGKIILYDRKNYKQARKNLLLYNFSEVLLSKNLLDFCRNYHGANFHCLNYP